MEKTAKKLEQLLFVFLFINPLLDLIYGIQIYFLNGGSGVLGSYQLEIFPAVSISLVIRMVLLILMAVYILLVRDYAAIATGICMVLSLGVTVALAMHRGNFSVGEDVSAAARYAYNLVALITFSHIFTRSGKSREELRNKFGTVIAWTLFVISAGVIIPFIVKVGFYTYADRFGLRGSRGMFYSGNDIACLLIVFLPLILCELMRQERILSIRSMVYTLAAALCMNTMLVLGTKTVYLALPFVLLVLLVYAVVRLYRGDRVTLLHLAITAALFAAIYLLISMSTQNGVTENIQNMTTMTTENYTANGTQAAVFSGRTDKFIATFRAFRAALPLSALFGISRGSLDFVIEMDVFELIFYFGILGTAAMTWIYVRNAIIFIGDFFHNFGLTALCCALSLGLCTGYLVMAGHTLFSVTSGFYFAMAILYARWFTPKEQKKIKIA